MGRVVAGVYGWVFVVTVGVAGGAVFRIYAATAKYREYRDGVG